MSNWFFASNPPSDSGGSARKDQVRLRWGVPKQKRHCAAYGGISHQVIIVQKHKDFVIDVGQVIYQHRTIVCAWTREVSSIRPICASPDQSVGAELLLAVLHQPCGSRTRHVEVFRCQPIFHADNGLTRVVSDPLQHRILPHGGPRIRIHLPPAESHVRTLISSPSDGNPFICCPMPTRQEPPLRAA